MYLLQLFCTGRNTYMDCSKTQEGWRGMRTKGNRAWDRPTVGHGHEPPTNPPACSGTGTQLKADRPRLTDNTHDRRQHTHTECEPERQSDGPRITHTTHTRAAASARAVAEGDGGAVRRVALELEAVGAHPVADNVGDVPGVDVRKALPRSERAHRQPSRQSPRSPS